MRPSFLFPLLIVLVSVFARPVAAQKWAQVSVGEDHACALDAEGRAYCWGNNQAGQLGARTPEVCGKQDASGRDACHPDASDTIPLPVSGDMHFAQVGAGRFLSCALNADGRAFCWGEPLGDGPGYDDSCLDGACSLAPVPVQARRRFAAMHMGVRCMADRVGPALCWDTGFRAADDYRRPWPDFVAARVAGDPADPTLCALDGEGRAFCRGETEFGVVGNGSREYEALGQPADHPAPFTQLAVTWRWVCALDAEGAAFCWGAEGYNDASADATRAGFERCDRDFSYTWCNTRPAPVSGGLRFRFLAAMPQMHGVREMVGLTEDGRAYVWDGSREPRPWHPEQRWTSVASEDWGQCGVTTDGELFCWRGGAEEDEAPLRIPHPAAR